MAFLFFRPLSRPSCQQADNKKRTASCPFFLISHQSYGIIILVFRYLHHPLMKGGVLHALQHRLQCHSSSNSKLACNVDL